MKTTDAFTHERLVHGWNMGQVGFLAKDKAPLLWLQWLLQQHWLHFLLLHFLPCTLLCFRPERSVANRNSQNTHGVDILPVLLDLGQQLRLRGLQRSPQFSEVPWAGKGSGSGTSLRSTWSLSMPLGSWLRLGEERKQTLGSGGEEWVGCETVCAKPPEPAKKVLFLEFVIHGFHTQHFCYLKLW